jgi:hypothetical protein
MAAPQGPRPGPGPDRAARAALFVGTILAIIAVAVLPLLTPVFIHPALDAAGSAEWLGVTAGEAHRMSDLSVMELLAGPGTFAFNGPGESGRGAFYDLSERGHLADARLLLWLCLVAGMVSLAGLGILLARATGEGRRAAWRTISRAGATASLAVVALALVSLVAFEPLFTLFHQVFFPGGNWAFDPATQRLVQLYPFAFWQIAAAALGVLVLALGLVTWWLGRRLSRPVWPADAVPLENATMAPRAPDR